MLNLSKWEYVEFIIVEDVYIDEKRKKNKRRSVVKTFVIETLLKINENLFLINDLYSILKANEKKKKKTTTAF